MNGGITGLLSMLVSFHIPFWLVFPLPFSIRSLLYTLISHFPVWYRVRGARMGGEGGLMGGVEVFLNFL